MRILTILLFQLMCVLIYGQRGKANTFNEGTSCTILGKVMDESSDLPLEFATVAVYSQLDSTLLGGSITDINGEFSFNFVFNGIVFTEVEYIGYEKQTISDIQSASKVDLGVISLSSGGINLDEVVVTGEKSDLQFSLDKRVFNVGKDLASRGGSASDVLDNIPSVSVGVEGEVNLRGSSNVRILINGRPSGLLGLNGTDGLRSIQANMIERVEIITNPSSKYEAEGMSGIINIILKKDRSGGFNGSFEVTGGTPTQYGAGANVNYRKNRLNWFLNYNINKNTGPSVGTNYQEFFSDDFTIVSVQNTVRNRSSLSNSLRFGSDFMLSDKQVLTASFLYRHQDQNNVNNVYYRDSLLSSGKPNTRLVEDDFSQYLWRQDVESEIEPTLEYSLHYDKQFEKKDHKLEMDVSFQSNTEKQSSEINENIYKNEVLTANNTLEQRANNSEGQRQWRTQLDYVRPFENEGKIETGFLGTFRKIDNNYLVESLLEDAWTTEVNLSNDFIYNENVLGAYLNYGKQYKKWSYQLGSRVEYSDIKTELLTTNEINDRDYLNFFPSAFLSYKLTEFNSLQASYSRRIRRPRFWDLNPFFTFTDRRNLFTGNPNLNPEFTDSYELSFLKYWEWGNIGSSAYYRYTTDLITRIQKEDVANQSTIIRPENVGTEKNIGIELLIVYNGLKWLRLDGAVNGYRFVTEGETEDGQFLQVDNFAWTSNLNSRFTFWKGTDLQLRLNYRAPRESLQGKIRSMTSLNIAISKDVTPDLTLTFSVQDAFNRRRRNSVIDTDNLYQESVFQWRPRSFVGTINYRINAKKERPKKRGYEGDGDMEM